MKSAGANVDFFTLFWNVMQPNAQVNPIKLYSDHSHSGIRQ